MNDSRNTILNRVREAMKQQAPRPATPVGPQPWFSHLTEDTETWIARFRQELETLKGEFLRAANPSIARQQIRELCVTHHFQKIAASDDPLLHQLFEGQPVQWIGPNSEAGSSLESFDLGVTRADALAARTGSIFLSARSGSGRALSVLPPVHLVVALKEELVADLAGGLERWQRQYGSGWPSNAFIITGPSRTSDIEKVLVLGAHGPKRVITLLLA